VVAGAWLAGGAPAAELDGNAFPETMQVGGAELRLNGIGLRTFSWLRIRIYVAALYLERTTHDAAAILASPERKLLDVRFIHDVDAERARDAWREGLEGNCKPPCRLQAADVARFLAAVPAMRAGDRSRLIFSPGRLDITMNDRPVGTITDPLFIWAVLATFIGVDPPTEPLRDGLLGQRN
jgi:hypothetical protein